MKTVCWRKLAPAMGLFVFLAACGKEDLEEAEDELDKLNSEPKATAETDESEDGVATTAATTTFAFAIHMARKTPMVRTATGVATAAN